MASGTFGLKQRAEFCRRMGIGLRSGLDPLRLLESEAKTGSLPFKQAILGLRKDVQSGRSMAEAMTNQGRFFPPLMIQLVNAGELGGRLEASFMHLGEYYDDLRQTRNEFLQRLAWPVFQLGIACLIVSGVILLQGILAGPQGPAFDASGLGLSGFSGFLFFWMILALFFGFLALLGYGVLKNWFNCHQFLMPLVQRIPVLGKALTTLGLSRFCMTMSTLLNAGVDAKRSVKQAFYSTGNHYFISGKDVAVDAVAKGMSFSDAIAAPKVFPDEFIKSLEVAEMSGTETESLDRLATQYKDQGKMALMQISWIVSLTIWLGIMAFMAFYIIRLFMNYIALLNSFM